MSRLPDSAHTERPWLVHEVAPDFELDDVWRMAMPGATAEDFGRALEIFGQTFDEERLGPVARFLFAVRWRLGAAFGWDEAKGGVGDRVRPVADRVPEHLRGDVTPHPGHLFTPVYRLADEAAEELANETVHGLSHLGWVPVDDGHELHLASLIKPNGVKGRVYMTLIKPFRVLVVWPALVRATERAWREREPVQGGRWVRTPEGLSITPDYVDRFELTTEVVATTREWARAMFEDGVPRSARELLFGSVLGCTLVEDGTAGAIAGMLVDHEDDRRLLLAMSGPRVRSTLLVEVTPGGVGLTTAEEYVTALGRLIWTVVSIRHRQLAAPLLRAAADRLRLGQLEHSGGNRGA